MSRYEIQKLCTKAIAPIKQTQGKDIAELKAAINERMRRMREQVDAFPTLNAP
jgi:hypothetical protein